MADLSRRLGVRFQVDRNGVKAVCREVQCKGIGGNRLEAILDLLEDIQALHETLSAGNSERVSDLKRQLDILVRNEIKKES